MSVTLMLRVLSVSLIATTAVVLGGVSGMFLIPSDSPPQIVTSDPTPRPTLDEQGSAAGDDPEMTWAVPAPEPAPIYPIVPAPTMHPAPEPSPSDPSLTDAPYIPYQTDNPVAYGANLEPSTDPSTPVPPPPAESPNPTPPNDNPPPASPSTSTPVKAAFTLATFNALGHSHTKPRGNKCCKWAGSRTRTRWAIDLFDRHQIEVVGLQEFQTEQKREFLKRVGDVWGLHAYQDNAVAWRKDTFTFVAATTLTVPYFHGKPKPMPVVTLRDRRSDQEIMVMSVHNPASVRGPAQHHRDEARRRQLDFATRIRSGANPPPVFVVGDMNDKADYFCPFTATGVMHSAAGGSHSNGRCNPPSFGGIDWIFGSTGVQFSGFTVDDTRFVDKTTDHPLIVAEVR